MISKAGRIYAKTIDEAAAQIPDDIEPGYKIWKVASEVDCYEWRGWVKEGKDG